MGAKDVPTGGGACVRTKQSALCALSAHARRRDRMTNEARCHTVMNGWFVFHTDLPHEDSPQN
eukprot:scaffold42434_cov60-Phaeocystis_antarctica.AAC.6